MVHTILSVEDSQIDQEYMSTILENAGYEVIRARDGQDAFRALLSNEIHLVISDVMMPNLDGISFCETLRKLYNGTPVILCTATENNDLLKCALQAGCADWVNKPMDPVNLLSAIRYHLSHLN